MNNVEIALKEMEEFSNNLTNYTLELKNRSGDKMLDYFSKLRGFPLETIKELDIFYIEDATEMLLPSYFGMVEDFGVISPTNKKPIFHNRFVMPIKDSDGKVLNLVGYSKEADERYVYGTARYYRRRDTMYGMENMQVAYDCGYAIITEGITDTIRVRSLGFKNSFAMCGTHGSTSILRQLNRLKYGIIKIPDRDSAGQRALKKWECNRSITLNTYIKYKDIDEMCFDSKDNEDLVKEYIDICVDWIKMSEHRGFKTASETITMQ